MAAGTTVALFRNTASAPFAAAYSGLADGVWYFHVRAVDTAGAAGPTATRAVRIDTTAPVTGVSGLASNDHSGWSNRAVTVTLDPSDAGSGVADTYYTVDGTRHTYGSPFQVSGTGSHAVTYWSVDAAGNTGAPRTGYVNIDTTAPVTTDDAPPGWVNHRVTVTLVPTDTGSGMSGGLAGTWHRLDGAARIVAGTSVTVSGTGIHALTYYSRDAAGNVETTRSVLVRIDTVRPVTLARPAAARRTTP